MTKEEAIAKLKETKELLDLGMIKQEDYDKLKLELTPIIMKQQKVLLFVKKRKNERIIAS